MRSTILGVILLVLLGGCSNSSQDIDYRDEMRKFVQEIATYAKGKVSNFSIIPQNGQELVTDTGEATGAIEVEYISAIDGIGREDLFYGYTADDIVTPIDETEYMISLCNIYKKHGKSVLVIDYCSTEQYIDKSYLDNYQNGYISFAANNRELTTIPPYPLEPYNSNNLDITSISDAKNFLYLINGNSYSSKSELLTAIKNTNYDLIIMDLFQDGVQFTSTEIEDLKTKMDGGKRVVVCYVSIGEAEDYRYYWNSEWNYNRPSWLEEENPNWEGNYKVEYWNKEWKGIIYGNTNSYLDRILDAGFDGVYLDIIDAFEYFEDR